MPAPVLSVRHFFQNGLQSRVVLLLAGPLGRGLSGYAFNLAIQCDEYRRCCCRPIRKGRYEGGERYTTR